LAYQLSFHECSQPARWRQLIVWLNHAEKQACPAREGQELVGFYCLLSQAGLDRFGGRARDNIRTSDASSPFGVLAAHQMASAAASSLGLAGAGKLDSLG
jgi:hypothetical protein